jgi:ATP-dependent protease ClpP protease subunit
MTKDVLLNGEIVLFGPVGFTDFDGNGFTAADFLDALSRAEGDVTIRINSGGGYAWDGISIYNAILAHEGNVTIRVDGIAASAASIIAMAADTLIIPDSATLMIHNASVLTWGNKQEHLKGADVLARLDGQGARIYAKRTGKSEAEMAEMMTAETWMTGKEAVDLGFADSTGEETAKLPAPFQYDIYARAPKGLPRPNQSAPAGVTLAARAAFPHVLEKEISMSTKKDPVAEPAPVPTSEQNLAPAATAAKAADIRRAVQAAKLPDAFALDLITEGVTMAAASERIFQKLEDDDKEKGPSVNAVVMADGIDRMRQGATYAIAARAGLAKREAGNEFNGFTLKELARHTLAASGVRTAGMSAMELVGAAFVPQMAGAMHTRSDFGSILADVANKAMLKGYEAAPETFERWTSRGVLTDFKVANRVDTGMFPSLLKVEEGSEYQYATMSDRGVQLVLATYGRRFSITRQAIINDDLDAFSRVPSKMGGAAKRTIGNLAYALLTGNPTFAGSALFAAGRNNLQVGAGSALAIASLTTGRTAMARQKDPDSIASLNIRPKYLLVPVELETQAAQLMNAENDATKSTPIPNPLRGFAEVVAEARLSDASATGWYLAGDPTVYDTVEVSYLDGVEAPRLEQMQGWSVDGTEFKVGMDAGVNPLDFRALYRSNGV